MRVCQEHLARLTDDEIGRLNKEENDSRIAELSMQRESCERRSRHQHMASKRGFVYLMAHSKTGLTKIGFSSKPARREKTLQAEDPGIEKVFETRGALLLEEKCHQTFANLRVRGEWFNLNSEQLKQCQSILLEAQA